MCYNTVRTPTLCIHDTLDMFIFFLPTLSVAHLMFDLAVQSISLNSFTHVLNRISDISHHLTCIELYISTPFDLDLKIVTEVTLNEFVTLSFFKRICSRYAIY